MENGLIDTAAQTTKPEDRRIYGTALAEVIENCDLTKKGRVRIRLPWLPGYEPWARVAAAMAGDNRGAYVMPRVGDEVLVVFNHGDVREPFVIGSVWNGKGDPPVEQADDADALWIIRTSKGHELAFDDAKRTVRIVTMNKQRVTLTDTKVEISVDDGNDTAVTLETNGNVTVQAKNTLTLKASSIVIQGSNSVAIKDSNTVTIQGKQSCSIDASSIDIGQP